MVCPVSMLSSYMTLLCLYFYYYLLAIGNFLFDCSSLVVIVLQLMKARSYIYPGTRIGEL